MNKLVIETLRRLERAVSLIHTYFHSIEKDFALFVSEVEKQIIRERLLLCGALSIQLEFIASQLFNYRIPVSSQANDNKMPEDREIASPVISNVKNPPWGTQPDTPGTGLSKTHERLADQGLLI